MRKSFLSVPIALLLLAPLPAHAVSKEMVQLQTQVQQLEDMLQHLQQSNDERMGVLQHLVEQSSDSVNRMSQQLTALQGQVEQNSKNDTLTGQIQGLNDSVDELKTRLGQVNKQLGDIQSQLQNVQSQPTAASLQTALPGGGAGLANTNQSPRLSAPPQAPPIEETYQSAMRDYNGARYDLATAEFADVIKFYPDNPLSGNSNYYLGEIAFRQAPILLRSSITRRY